MAHFVSVKNRKGTYELFEVSEEVQTYVKQLETYINSPKESKLLKVYADRFIGAIRREEAATSTLREITALYVSTMKLVREVRDILEEMQRDVGELRRETFTNFLKFMLSDKEGRKLYDEQK